MPEPSLCNLESCASLAAGRTVMATAGVKLELTGLDAELEVLQLHKTTLM